MSERTAVYRLYDATGALLYVGISKSFGQRWQQHAAMQPWYPHVQRQTVDWCSDRDAALAAERTAIEQERPRYNVVHGTQARRPPGSAAERLAALQAAPPPTSPVPRRLRSLALQHHRAAVQQDASHRTLVAAIWEAHDEGMRQVDIVGAVDLTRERVRQLCDPKYRARHSAVQ